MTAFLSIYSLKFYQFNGRLPGYDRIQAKNQNIDPDKAAFSMAPHDEEAYAHVNQNDHDADPHDAHHDAAYDHDQDHGYGGHSPGHSPGHDPFRTGSAAGRHENPFDDSAEYRPQTGPGPIYVPPTAQDDYDDDRPVRFPAANYDRVV